MPLIPTDITKNKRSQYQKFIDTTPSGNSRTWKVLGIGVTEASVSYNPQIDTEQWIIEDSARNDHTGNQKQLSVTQKCYKGDPEFEYINAGRDKTNYTSHILEIDTWNGTSNSYPAKQSDCLIAITSYSGEEIEYTIYFNGDPAEGSATIANGVPTFTPTVS
jgi:hypothetical protein